MTDRARSAALDRDAVRRYVLSRRTPSGGYSFYRTPEWGVEEPNAPDTLAACQSLRLLHVQPPEPEATAAWLLTLQAEDGGYPSLTIGWAALRALRTLKLEPRYSPAAWLRRCATALRRPEQREWRRPLRDALHLAELFQLAAVPFTADESSALNDLLQTTRDCSGGWSRPSADLETTGIAVTLVGLADVPMHDPAGITSFLSACEDDTLGLRLAPYAHATSAGAIWGGLQIAHALGVRPHWPAAIARSLALLQRPDGGLGSRHRAISTLRDTWRGLQAAQLLSDLQEATS